MTSSGIALVLQVFLGLPLSLGALDWGVLQLMNVNPPTNRSIPM